MVASILDETNPNVNFTDVEYQNFNDSIIFTANYYLNIEFTNDLSDRNYSGNTRIVLKIAQVDFGILLVGMTFNPIINLSIHGLI